MTAANNNADLFGLDLASECVRLRAQNATLVKAIALAVLGGSVAVVFGLMTLLVKPERERVAVDAAGRVVPLVSLTKGDPPDARVTRMASDCLNGLFNHAFHNYQTTVERTVGECFTGGGSESVRKLMEPFIARMKSENVNMAANFVIQPFINSRKPIGTGAGMRNVFNIQGIIAIGYRGSKVNTSVAPTKYIFQTDVVRVSYDSHIEGIRLQNVVLVPYEG